MGELFNTRRKMVFNKIQVDNVVALNDFFRYANVMNVPSDCYPICGLTYLKGLYGIIDGFCFVTDCNKHLMGIPLDKNGIMINPLSLHDIMITYGIKMVYLPECCDYLVQYDSDIDRLFSKRRTNQFGNEYIFDNFALSELSGGQYKNLRKSIRGFEKDYIDKSIISIIPYDYSMYDEALECYDAWMKTSGKKIVDAGREVWDEDYFKLCISNFDKLNLDIFLIKDISNDKFVGCYAYEIIGDDYAYGVFRKANPEYPHMTQYVQWIQSNLMKEYGIRYFNDAYDGGDKGLMDLKAGFKPVRINKFISLRPILQEV